MCRGRLRPRLDDMNTDYSYSIIARQRQQDFAAEAVADRLARLATADRTPWWRHLGQALLPRPTRTLTAQHRLAH